MQSYYDFNIKKNLLVYDDVKIEFFHVKMFSLQKMFHMWFHTSFVDEETGILPMNKSMIDKVCKDKKHVKYDEYFRIEIYTSKINYPGFTDQTFKRARSKVKDAGDKKTARSSSTYASKGKDELEEQVVIKMPKEQLPLEQQE